MSASSSQTHSNATPNSTVTTSSLLSPRFDDRNPFDVPNRSLDPDQHMSTLIHHPNSIDEAVEDEVADQGPKKVKQKPPVDKNAQLRRDLRTMLVGYGDVEKPRRDTVDVLVELTLQYLNNLAGYMKHLAPNKKISLEVLYYMVRNDQAKFMRVRELLKMNEELKKAKKDYRTGDETPFD